MSILALVLVFAIAAGAGALACARPAATPVLRLLAYALAAVASTLIALPLSIAITLSADPLWNLVGSVVGVSLVRRRGPPIPCYVVTFTACLAVLGTSSIAVVRHRLQLERGEAGVTCRRTRG